MARWRTTGVVLLFPLLLWLGLSVVCCGISRSHARYLCDWTLQASQDLSPLAARYIMMTSTTPLVGDKQVCLPQTGAASPGQSATASLAMYRYKSPSRRCREKWSGFQALSAC
ncbi:hypothetical protein B0T16DRAFT_398427 [Cercophora newfieldiana]|uniref:Uncharacterized protein n=1 Tax=Cercophora newfieldiana TaxID=92897 RepID=A0AA40CYA1_9PEZI|nr:hypothetical protein B0T16DRAFT_398427 [Cercophora newfieldiana]